jgi:hypothetical protein
MGGKEQLVQFLQAAILRGNNPSAALQRPISTIIESEKKLLMDKLTIGRAEAQHMILRNEVCSHPVSVGGVCIRCGWSKGETK